MLRAEDSPERRDRWSYVLLAEEIRRLLLFPERGCAGALPPDVLQRADLEHRRSSAQPCGHPRPAPTGSSPPPTNLTPSMPVSAERRDLAMACGRLWTLGECGKTCFRNAPAFIWSAARRKRSSRRWQAQVRERWYEVARRRPASAKPTAETISSAFAYPGFRSEACRDGALAPVPSGSPSSSGQSCRSSTAASPTSRNSSGSSAATLSACRLPLRSCR